MAQEKVVNVNIPLKGRLLEKANGLKDHYGIESYTELMRLIINDCHSRLLSIPETLPRFEQINSDENGVKIHDRVLHEVVEVYIKPKGIQCSYDQTDQCEHVSFALTLPEVKAQIRKHRKEGWKLPDV